MVLRLGAISSKANMKVRVFGKRASIALFLFLTSCSCLYPLKKEVPGQWDCASLDCSRKGYIVNRCYLSPSCPLQGLGIELTHVNGATIGYLETHRLTFPESEESPGYVYVKVFIESDELQYCLKILKGGQKARMPDEMLQNLYWASNQQLCVTIVAGRFRQVVPPFSQWCPTSCEELDMSF